MNDPSARQALRGESRVEIPALAVRAQCSVGRQKGALRTYSAVDCTVLGEY
jgi:hypothetical protein